MEVVISAIGTANPIHKRSQDTAAELVADILDLNPSKRKKLFSIYRATGIDTRYSVIGDYLKKPGEFDFFPNDMNLPFPSTAERMKVYKDNALQLSLDAIRDCLTSIVDFDIKTITHIITVSCTGMYAPGLDIEIVHSLNLRSDTKRTCINFMGCYGAFNAMKMGADICKADSTSKVLVVCIELCTIHFQKNQDTSNLISNAIFADGAAAAIIQAKASIGKQLILDHFYCDLIPQSNREMTWHISDQGFDIALSSYVPKIIKSGIGLFMKKLSQRLEYNLSDDGIYAIHPGGIKILQACEEALNLKKEHNKFSYDVLKNFGNMSSATILFVLKRVMDNLRPLDDSKNIFSCAFGPGLTLESMLMRVSC